MRRLRECCRGKIPYMCACFLAIPPPHVCTTDLVCHDDVTGALVTQLGGYRVKSGTIVLLGTDLMYAIDEEQCAAAAAAPGDSAIPIAPSLPPAALDSGDCFHAFRPERWLQPGDGGDGFKRRLHVFSHGSHSCAVRMAILRFVLGPHLLFQPSQAGHRHCSSLDEGCPNALRAGQGSGHH